jgi:hypothetical protein
MPKRLHPMLALILGLLSASVAWSQDARTLRLVPFPKEVRLQQGEFTLNEPLTLELSKQANPVLVSLLGDELKRAGLPAPEVRIVTTDVFGLRLSHSPRGNLPKLALRPEAGEEDYAVQIRSNEIICSASADAGLLYGVQTLRQLIRANRRDGQLPCLDIRDWPSLRWRCFQDDMTRGPSPKMEVLKLQADLGAFFKMNLVSYYMEHQFAFKGHPLIGPKDGSLTPEELKAWVAYAKPLGLDILGNQQSFGHFYHILKHDQYASLRENGSILCPLNEGTYRLLDEMYAEVCPLTPFSMFNVCCDETEGLGGGPSKVRAEKIGVGGVYVEHIRRVHDLLKEKYGKRMMMWGDIILKHPENLKDIPKDTIMLTWGYGASPSFEHQIVPFAKSGFKFFVCPGVSNWSRILPDFGCATVNIQNFVRDGVKHGAIGMLNTDWEDDGESHNAPTWHGDAWGAECAWNASTTSPEEFNRRIGAVLFGEKGDHFGRAIELLTKTHRLAGMDAMNNRRFWTNDFLPKRAPATTQSTANRLLEIVRPAIAELEACQKDAACHTEVLDYFLFGARRMELIGQRMLDGLQAAQLYNQACEVTPQEAVPLLIKVEALVRKNRDAHESLGQQFSTLWLKEAKPYALENVMKRYAATVKWYDDLGARLADARKKAAAGQRVPRPETLGISLPEAYPRRARPRDELDTPLEPATAWSEPSASHRLGLVVRAGSADRYELPVEANVTLPTELADKPIRAFCLLPGKEPQEIAAQLDPTGSRTKRRLVMLVPGSVPKNTALKLFVYLGLRQSPSLAQAVSTKEGPNGMKWIENDKVRLLLGPEGGHVYRWEVKSLGGRDLTVPGEKGWAGFADVHTLRTATYRLTCIADGPALVRYECAEPSGHVKTISLYAGASWMEVMLNDGTRMYWDYDNPKNFAADGPTPGTYLFSNGKTGPVGKQAEGVAAQVDTTACWSVKFNRDRLALGLCTPEVSALHHLAPGSGAGGVGIEHSPDASHFITFGGLLDAEPAATMNRLKATLDLKNQPEVVVHAVQRRE